MTFVATRTRFGRYVYAIGGNPEAAELAGINTKRITVLVFALMGDARGHLRLHHLGAARLGDQRARHSSTNSMSSPPPSSAALRSPAASARSTAR